MRASSSPKAMRLQIWLKIWQQSRKPARPMTTLSGLRTMQMILEPLRFLRQREIVHFQRFGEALSLVQQRLDFNNFYAFNPEFDKKCK